MFDGTVFEIVTAGEVLGQAECCPLGSANLPIYRGTFLSDDRRSIALEIPVADRQDSHKITEALRGKVAAMRASNSYSFTGLPVAQAQFDIEMFVQMAIAAPAAMMLIFLLLLAICRSARCSRADGGGHGVDRRGDGPGYSTKCQCRSP